MGIYITLQYHSPQNHVKLLIRITMGFMNQQILLFLSLVAYSVYE